VPGYDLNSRVIVVDLLDEAEQALARLGCGDRGHYYLLVWYRILYHLLAGREITGTELRQVRLAEVVQAASPHCVTFALGDGETTAITAAEVTATDGRRLPKWLADSLATTAESRALPEPARTEAREARLDAVQLVYGVAALTGQPPAKAIERELGAAPRTAAHWIRLARNAGRLEGLGYAAGRPPRG